MAIQFQPVKPLNLELPSGRITGDPTQMATLQPTPETGVPTEQLQKEVADLTNKGIPIDKILNAIEAHPDITDKENAKKIASAIYEILGKSSGKK